MEDIQRDRIVRVDKCILRGTRPRSIGHDARLGDHGPRLADPVARLHTADGHSGIGWSNVTRDQAHALLGQEIQDCFKLPEGALEAGRAVDLPLWDLVSRAMELPLYRLLGARGKRRVEAYDASLYIDDLHVDDAQAEDIFRAEVASGQEHGYCNFKIQVGRGARWMSPAAGMARDALVVRVVRDAAGPEARIMADAHMGNTLNTAQALLGACTESRLHWFEEPFAEDRALNLALKDFLLDQEMDTLVADGKSAPPACFFDLVRDGLIDVVQHDFRVSGLTWWRAVAARLEQWDVLCAPHTWGSYVERFHHAHFAASIPNYALLEAAPAYVPGLLDDDWHLEDGCLRVPDTPGAGFDVAPEIFRQGLQDREGFSVSL